MEATAEAAEAASRALSERVAPLEGGLAQQSYAQEDLEGRMHEAQAAMEEVTSHVQSQLEHVHRALQQEQQDATAAVQVREFFPIGIESIELKGGKLGLPALTCGGTRCALSSPACVRCLFLYGPRGGNVCCTFGQLDATSGERSGQRTREQPARVLG